MILVEEIEIERVYPAGHVDPAALRLKVSKPAVLVI